ncbi:MAG TPA: hypothetical protein PK156_26865 [Polyangium sp.]|nr:hypothetical protein [Polyangium sp.]
MATDQRVYRLHVSEFDNLLLSDVDALMGCSSHIHNRDRADVENRIENEAQKRIWWVTCIRFLAETKMKSREGYPADPNFSAIQSQQAAEQYVLNALWFKNTALHCPSLVDPTTVSQELAAMHGIVNKQFTSGTWRQEFPGKEIFKAIATYLNGQNSGLDFYKSVGDWQREHAKQTGAPLPLADLRQSILTRIGIVTPAPP